ncbi:cytochrome oxidase assembly [Gloeophyllum trabeum ATCC 11539]|uniref:Cytochrome oxidase assembly n=1 Tax=Gloeophyllum trabeum (strain ATCC 11539 / FP-39264 / Madison 617) TaxID=670483 RepID=S7QJM8_GLOTA|nr:cytochrome oxidase assembly [Gloeophyllum trabeum ATCC 11539]EPQ59522.1 cytochrome oxidase assembly [Gloeophyllum trabeum ATCC 11539]
MFSSALVFAVIVVGGVTRLTESGLSITEWKPITGILPPLTQDDWNVEFEKYKATPEFKMLNHSMTVDEFKSIFYMEWGHRVLGRIIGIAFVVPLAYFALRKQLSASMPRQLTAMAALIGVQGLLGWYMVKSGLEDSIVETNSVPRVSQYRLAAHLGTAFVLYAGMIGTGLAVLFDWKYANKGVWSGLKDGTSWQTILSNPLVKRFSRASWALTGLVFLTALSGAFVAGLDAGLVYNEFPYMGGRLVPPTNELFDPAYAKDPSRSDLWRNVFENPTTVQFDHRVLATTTYFATAALYAASLRPAYKAILPPMAKRFAAIAFGVANIQVILGISTLLYLVPVSLAACHQAGSVALLTSMIHLLVALRRPGAAARAWRQASVAARRQRQP